MLAIQKYVDRAGFHLFRINASSGDTLATGQPRKTQAERDHDLNVLLDNVRAYAYSTELA